MKFEITKFESVTSTNDVAINLIQKKKNYYKTIGAEGFTNLLISYKGIGPWTVDMAKMFFLGDNTNSQMGFSTTTDRVQFVAMHPGS